MTKPLTQRARDYENVFPSIASTHSELWDFPYLHKIVLGILHVDLETTLQDPHHRAFLDKLDSQGRTALLWEALRGDETAVKTLLRAGADISPQDWERRTALHSAVVSDNVRCVELLLMAGSSVHTRDDHGHTAILMAAWANDNPAMIETLYLAGASLTTQNFNLHTPLLCATDLNHHRNMERLLAMGADLECKDKDGDSPLFEALRYGNHEALEVVLRHGPQFDYTNKLGQTALHIAALFGTVRSVEMLQQVDLRGLDVEQRDWKERTAMEALQDRVASPHGLREAMEHLVQHVAGTYEEDDDTESDTYLDALEHLDLVEQ